MILRVGMNGPGQAGMAPSVSFDFCVHSYVLGGNSGCKSICLKRNRLSANELGRTRE